MMCLDSCALAILTVRDVEPSDTGHYKCEASNKLGIVESEAMLTIHCKPIIHFEPALKDTQILKTGNTLIIMASVTGERGTVPKRVHV